MSRELTVVSAKGVRAPTCDLCANYGDFGPRGGGTLPWSVCRFRLVDAQTCGRFELDERRLSWGWSVDDTPQSPQTATFKPGLNNSDPTHEGEEGS